MYRSFEDTGWIELNQLNVFVGKNESGKTTLLKALYKLKSHSNEKFDINNEWPRGRRTERNENISVISVEFEFTSDIFDGIENKSFQVVGNRVVVSKNYKNELSINCDLLKYEAVNKIESGGADDKNAQKEELDKFITSVKSVITKRIPNFIYMSDFRIFDGSAILNQILERKQQNKLNEQDKTIITIMELSGLDLESEVQKGNIPDRTQRQYDLDDASATLTREISTRWSQKRYEVQFRADGQSFFTFVKDEHDPSLIKLEERSKGFQWFFSFDLMFMYESQGTFKNCIILLDEPGLHLHPEGQKDLLVRLQNYSKDNCVVYTSHLPFMIDLSSPSTIKIISEKEGKKTIADDIISTDKESRLVLQAALGIGGSNHYLVSELNLVVEGVDDYWFISEFSNYLRNQKKEFLKEGILITPCGGASEVVYIATFMIGQELKVCALFDFDDAGRTASEKLIKNWLTKYNSTSTKVFLLNDICDIPKKHFGIEDLFCEDYYLKKVNEAYSRLQRPVKKEDLNGDDSIVKQLERFFSQAGQAFNKGTVAKLIKSDIVKNDPSGFSEKTIDNFAKLIKSINGAL